MDENSTVIYYEKSLFLSLIRFRYFSLQILNTNSTSTYTDTDLIRTNVQRIPDVFAAKLQIGSTIRRTLESDLYVLHTMQY